MAKTLWFRAVWSTFIYIYIHIIDSTRVYYGLPTYLTFKQLPFAAFCQGRLPLFDAVHSSNSCVSILILMSCSFEMSLLPPQWAWADMTTRGAAILSCFPFYTTSLRMYVVVASCLCLLNVFFTCFCLY